MSKKRYPPTNDGGKVHVAAQAKPTDTISPADVRCEQKLGELLKSYRWAA